MSVYAMGDLHLSLGNPEKTMEVFRGWQDYQRRIEENWRALVRPEDTVVLAGDLSWAMHLADTLADFRFLDRLPGRKLLMKGNHDYWWTTRRKMESFFAAEGLTTLEILHNNAVEAEGVFLCGSRGWLFEGSQRYDPLVVAREEGRIRRSLEAAPHGGKSFFSSTTPPPTAPRSCRSSLPPWRTTGCASAGTGTSTAPGPPASGRGSIGGWS